MCLIIAPGRDGKPALLPRDVFDYVYDKNNDGFGAMWTEDGQVKHFKGLSPSKDEEYALMQELTEKHPDIVFHMRYRTHGKTIPGLSHPFRLLHRSRHGKDMFFMHNGVLGQFGNRLSYGQSDTTVFKDKILIPLLTRNPDALDDPEIMDAIEKLTSGSRLIFMDSTGKVWRTHDTSWNSRYGLTLSNTYMLPSPPANNVYQLPGVGSTARDIYTIKRKIKFYGGEVREYWCKMVDHRYVRTESGLLFKDHGPDVEIEYTVDYIPKRDEYKYLSFGTQLDEELPGNAQETHTETEKALREAFDRAWKNDDLDDEVWDDDKKEVEIDVTGTGTVGDAIAGKDAQLRYARLVHNTHADHVAHREQLIADLLGMSREEMYGLVKEDPETSTTIMEELIEIFFQMNDLLVFDADGSYEDCVFDPDELINRGEIGYHRTAMEDITKARRAHYEEQLAEAQRKEQEKRVKEAAPNLTAAEVKKAM